MRYLQEAEYYLSRIWFDYLGGRYEGRGILNWEPEQGFHIEAFIERERENGPLPDLIEIGKVGLLRKDDIGIVRMKSPGFHLAVARVPLFDRADVIVEKRLSVKLGSITFYRTNPIYVDDTDFYGRAFFEAENLLLPDTIITKKDISGYQGGTKIDRGINYDIDNNHAVFAHIAEDKTIELFWRLSKSKWSKTDSFNWPEAIRYALSVLSGQEVRLLQKETDFLLYGRRQVYKRELGQHLGVLSPLPQDILLKREFFILLTEFFAKNEQNAVISRRIFDQILEASRQETLQGKELLLSTILEATLRTIENCPFKPGDNSFDMKVSLENFRKNYLSTYWEDACEKAYKVWRRLRHRNAHPDWLIGKGGAMSQENMESSLDDMIFLSRFYGYMILSLAGMTIMGKPVFPKTHRDWKASIIIKPNKPNI